MNCSQSVAVVSEIQSSSQNSSVIKKLFFLLKVFNNICIYFSNALKLKKWQHPMIFSIACSGSVFGTLGYTF